MFFSSHSDHWLIVKNTFLTFKKYTVHYGYLVSFCAETLNILLLIMYNVAPINIPHPFASFTVPKFLLNHSWGQLLNHLTMISQRIFHPFWPISLTIMISSCVHEANDRIPLFHGWKLNGNMCHVSLFYPSVDRCLSCLHVLILRILLQKRSTCTCPFSILILFPLNVFQVVGWFEHIAFIFLIFFDTGFLCIAPAVLVLICRPCWPWTQWSSCI